MAGCLIVGGGVVGLSLAYELATRGAQVHVIDAGQPGRQASWAGAGILPPVPASSPDPLDRLFALSNQLHAQWAERLKAETGIDTGYRRSGAVYLVRNPSDAQPMERLHAGRPGEIAVEPLTPTMLADLEPALHPPSELQAAFLVPDECQLRNPRHLKALVAACLQRGVTITPQAAALDFETSGDRVRAVLTAAGRFEADQFCLTTGTWTGQVAQKLGLHLAIKPIRGQIALLAGARQALSRIVNQGPHYLVPRDDGRVLVGSTLEDVGFDQTTTEEAIAELLAFAAERVPALAQGQTEQSWAGLRPSTVDGLPYLGRAPQRENLLIASGHYRSGLQLSPGTAVVMAQLMAHEKTAIALSAFAVDRVIETA